ncbi:MAG TPA: cytochrome P450 [Acidimicrobiia bacterium]|nr:cytochrome P450 [Acidimicrobiia bacterium]
MFDPYSPEFLEDPYPVYTRLRLESPVFHDPAWELTFFTRHADVSAILRDREHFGRDFRHRLDPAEVDEGLYRRIYPPQWPSWSRYIRESFIDLEPPRHTRLRRLVSQAFTRRSSEVFRPRLEKAADQILDRVLEEGKLEVIEDFATPIPVAMIAELMGIPSDDHAQLLRWSHAIVKVFDKNVTPVEGDAAEQATIDFVAYLKGVIDERRRRRGEDLISSMLEVEDRGDTLSDEEIVGTSILTLNAGHEATVHAIGNGLLALAGNRDQYQRLRGGEMRLQPAVDELLRFDSPLQMFERWVLADTELSGTRLEKGSKVGLLFGSANRDPDVFGPDAERLDLGRDPNPHVSFGAGLHYCVGAPLAMVELEAALGRFSARVADLEVRDVSGRIQSLVFRGLQHLEMEIAAA